MIKQTTLKVPVDCRGTGLHCGREIALALAPAEENAGVVVRRVDLMNGAREIRADWRHVTDTRLATTVANDHGASVSTIEHLMAALAGCGIDNVIVEVDGPEIPIMDGSAAAFVFLIERAGVAELDAPRKAIKILKAVSVADGDRSISISPASRFSIDFAIDFDSAAINRQRLVYRPAEADFRTGIANARTFGFAREVDGLRSAGYALGGSLENAVVIGDGDVVLNEGGLRHGDEFVRHKILDCIGDLYLAGGRIVGAVEAERSGHEMHNRLVRALFADDDAWTTVDAAA